MADKETYLTKIRANAIDYSGVKKEEHCVLSSVCWQVESKGETDESHLMCMYRLDYVL